MRFNVLSLAALILTGASVSATESELSINNFLQVTPNIYRGGRPAAADLKSLVSQYQIKTDIDVENDSSVVAAEQKSADALKMEFLSTPINAYATPTDAEINGVLAEMQNPKNFPLFLHCHYGDDRTGLIVAIYRIEVQGWTAQAAYNEMIQNGFHTVLVDLLDYFEKRENYTP